VKIKGKFAARRSWQAKLFGWITLRNN